MSSGRSRKRLPAAVAALVVVAFGLATALWLTGDTDDETPAVDTTAAATTAPATTVPALTLPTTPPSTDAAPTTESVAPTTAAPDPAPAVPDGSILVTDPTGWSMSMSPAWTESTQNTTRNWFTNTGSDTFDDNVNVTTEALTSPVALDDYLAAAIAGIQSSVPDFQLGGLRRSVGPDGVELALIEWSGTLENLPPLSFLQTIMVTPTTAYVATFTSEPMRIAQVGPTVEPYLLTLRGA
ncbi:MAG: hypothetical protein WEB78_08430 [Ilumatobacteraceae bacterium]